MLRELQAVYKKSLISVEDFLLQFVHF
jgi:hypothetical protein